MTDTSKLEQDDHKEEWPNIIRTRDELDSALEAGLKSGESERSIEEIFESAITKAKIGRLKYPTALTSFRGSAAEPGI